VRTAVAAVLLLHAASAQAGSLAECRGATSTPAELMACLQSARRVASDRMLESFLTVEQRLGRQDAAGRAERSRAMLKQSQRDFERYLQAHCQVALRLPGGAAAATACEVDQLHARSAALDLLADERPN
jgi:Lysozyme inhibitor LprI